MLTVHLYCTKKHSLLQYYANKIYSEQILIIFLKFKTFPSTNVTDLL